MILIQSKKATYRDKSPIFPHITSLQIWKIAEVITSNCRVHTANYFRVKMGKHWHILGWNIEFSLKFFDNFARLLPPFASKSPQKAQIGHNFWSNTITVKFWFSAHARIIAHTRRIIAQSSMYLTLLQNYLTVNQKFWFLYN